jgi:5-methyltetrahydrofolate--homocysteine methyltransferase
MNDFTDSAMGSIRDAVIQYNKDGISDIVKNALDAGVGPQKIIDEALIVAMDKVGQAFSAGDIYVAEMMVAALTMQAGLEVLKPCFPQSEANTRGTFVIGTVKGDLHDIGKNIVCMMVEGAGFKTVDLGVDVDADTFVREIESSGADIVGLSSLLTTSMPSMEAIVGRLRKETPDVKIVIGGAPVTGEFAERIGASGYGSDAVAAVDLVRRLIAG